MFISKHGAGLTSRWPTLAAGLTAMSFCTLLPTSDPAAAATPAAMTPTAAAAPATEPVAVHSGSFGLWAGGSTTTNVCLVSNATGSVYTLPCQVPDNRYQAWIWTEWQAYSPYSGDYYFYSLKNQATGRCLDSNAAGKVSTSPCQAPRTSNQDWSSPGFTNGWTTFSNEATGRFLYEDPNWSLFTAGAGGDNDTWMPIQQSV